MSDFVLTVSGVVMGPKGIFLHPFSFRDIFGEDAYRELLDGPRVVCKYDLEDEEGDE